MQGRSELVITAFAFEEKYVIDESIISKLFLRMPARKAFTVYVVQGAVTFTAKSHDMTLQTSADTQTKVLDCGSVLETDKAFCDNLRAGSLKTGKYNYFIKGMCTF